MNINLDYRCTPDEKGWCTRCELICPPHLRERRCDKPAIKGISLTPEEIKANLPAVYEALRFVDPERDQYKYRVVEGVLVDVS